MKANTRVIRNEIRNFLDYLLNEEIALYTSVVSDNGSVVSWHAVQDAPLLGDRESPTLATYRRWVLSGAYSAVLRDGALLQLTYQVDGGELVAHRLAYIPCPLALDPLLLQLEPVVDVLDLHMTTGYEALKLSSAFRFDFDLEASKPGHPAVHLTVNTRDCRIACRAPLRLGRFAEFVFMNFYPEVWRDHRYLRDMPRREWGSKTFTDEESRRPHISWAA